MLRSSSTISSLAISICRRAGQFDHETAARPFLAFDENFTAVRGHDVLGNCQSQAGRALLKTIGVVLRETLENVIADLARNARSRIRYLQTHVPVDRTRRDFNFAAF